MQPLGHEQQGKVLPSIQPVSPHQAPICSLGCDGIGQGHLYPSYLDFYGWNASVIRQNGNQLRFLFEGHLALLLTHGCSDMSCMGHHLGVGGFC